MDRGLKAKYNTKSQRLSKNREHDIYILNRIVRLTEAGHELEDGSHVEVAPTHPRCTTQGSICFENAPFVLASVPAKTIVPANPHVELLIEQLVDENTMGVRSKPLLLHCTPRKIVDGPLRSPPLPCQSLLPSHIWVHARKPQDDLSSGCSGAAISCRATSW